MDNPLSRDSTLIRLTEELYSIQVESVQDFERQHKDPVVNLVLTSGEGDRYFLKQIQPHSMRPELEEIYSRLGGLKTDGYRSFFRSSPNPEMHSSSIKECRLCS